MEATLWKRLAAEGLGTFWLVLGGCGSAVLAGSQIGWLGVSLAFGLTVLTGAYALGHISGGHFNPAVTIGVTVAGRFPLRDVLPYIAAQLTGAAVSAGVLFSTLNGNETFLRAGNFLAANGYGDQSPAGYNLLSAFLIETVLTCVFLIIILGATDKLAPAGFAPVAIGLGLTLIHLISIPVTNTSVNPARSFGPALFVGKLAIEQLWLFILAPILGAVLAGIVYPALLGSNDESLLEDALDGDA